MRIRPVFLPGVRRQVQIEADGQKRDCRRDRPDQPDRYRDRLPGDPFGVLERILDVNVPENYRAY